MSNEQETKKEQQQSQATTETSTTKQSAATHSDNTAKTISMKERALAYQRGKQSVYRILWRILRNISSASARFNSTSS